MIELLHQAALVSLPSSDNDNRNFWLGCIGIREDGALVASKNGAVEFSSTVENYQLLPSSHAEGRVLRKLGKKGILYIARVSKEDRSLKLASPCGMCCVRIKSFDVSRVYYTINNFQYGIWNLKKDQHTIHYV